MSTYSIDDLLGDCKNRYFGNGYKKIFHDVISINSSDGINWISHISVSKCSNWSIKNKVAQVQHVSSIDSLVITQKVFNCILSKIENNCDDYVLTDFDIKTGTSPIENIDDINVKFKLEKQNEKYILSGIIGNMKVKSEFEKCPEQYKNTFSEYKSINNQINEIIFQNNDYLICNYKPEATSDISVYLVSWLTVFAQLGEVLVFNAANVSREESKNFWVRKLHLHLNKEKLLKSNHSDELELKVIKNRELRKNDGIWHTFEMAGIDKFNLISVQAKTALQEKENE